TVTAEWRCGDLLLYVQLRDAMFGIWKFAAGIGRARVEACSSAVRRVRRGLAAAAVGGIGQGVPFPRSGKWPSRRRFSVCIAGTLSWESATRSLSAESTTHLQRIGDFASSGSAS